MKLVNDLSYKIPESSSQNEIENIAKYSRPNNLHINNIIMENTNTDTNPMLPTYDIINSNSIEYSNTIIINKESSTTHSHISSEKGTRPDKGRFRTLLLLLILVFSGIAMWLTKTNSRNGSSLQEGIAEDIIRFHVIANSDSSNDQALKLTVKNTLVKSLSPFLQDADTIDDARTILSDKLTYIQEVAEDTILQKGYNYPVSVSLEDCYFPLKIYGDYTFPSGTYEALRVQIGKAEGKNWWCVMFPPLCFVDETYSIVDEDSQKKLKHLLTEEEYDTLINQKTPIKIKFKLWEEIKKLFN